MTMQEVILIDDHPLFREGIKKTLSQSGRYEVIFETNCSKDAIEYIKENANRLAKALFIIDISLPHGSGFELLPQIFSAVGGEARCTMLSMHDEKEYAAHAMELGALGYVVKGDDPSNLLECLSTIAAGNKFMSEGVGREKPSHLAAIENDKKEKRPSHSHTSTANQSLNKLSKRELAILQLVAQEKTSREISEILFLSPRTVENHRANICGKLSITGAHGLLTYAVKHRNTIETLND